MTKPVEQSPQSEENDSAKYIHFGCPYCHRSVDYLKELAGAIQICSFCGKHLIVPHKTGEKGQAVPFPIKTPRLILRQFQGSDLDDLTELYLSPEVTRYAYYSFSNADQIKKWLEKKLRTPFSNPRKLALCVHHEQNNRLIGTVGLTGYGTTGRQLTFGISMKPQFHRQGFGSEVVRAILKFCFGEMGQYRVVAGCDARNLAARGFLIHCGFRQEAHFQKDHFVDGEWADMLWFAMLKEEFALAEKR